MTHIEGDGINEDLFYLLWRKDSPFNEKLNIKIPDTIVFRKGRPMSWYFTNNEGVVLRKKQSSLTFPEITKKFTRKANEGDIVAYFINIDEEKKLSRLLDKTQIRGMEQDTREESDELPKHDVDYYGLKEFISTFSDYKNFENKTGILQRFIAPYGSNNELIQAIWSPRVCVFTKRVNLRRLNETRFDVYERALTFDGPDFYSKNVPLRGGYIPGKLRATCDMIVRHIAYISYEKISIKRIVGYFKVDRDENVWFLWTSSIRINETSKTHKKMSQYVDKPLCLEPCMQTNENVRLIKSNFAAKPVSLQMNEECTICAKKVDKISTIPVSYKLLLGNEDILKRSEQKSEGRVKIFINGPDSESPEKHLPVSVRKGAIGVPAFIKRLHPGLTFKEFQVLREKDHFLMLKTDVCEECYLLVSKQFEGGFPYKLTEPKKRIASAQNFGTFRTQNMSSRIETASSKDRASSYAKLPSATNENQDEGEDSNDEIDEGDRNAAIFVTDNTLEPNRIATAGYSHRKKLQTISTEPEYYGLGGMKSYASTAKGGLSTAHSNKSGHLPLFLNGANWIKTAQKLVKTDHSTFESQLEETKTDSLHGDPGTLRRNVMKALGAETESSFRLRSVQSVKGLNSIDEIKGLNKNVKPSRPQTTIMKNNIKSVRSQRAKEKAQKETKKAKKAGDLFGDSSDGENSEFEDVLEMKSTMQKEKSYSTKDSSSFGRVDLAKTAKLFTNRTTTEEKLQDHLDQDMVLVMENATQDKNSVYFADFKSPYAEVPKKKHKRGNSFIKLKEHLAQNPQKPEKTNIRSNTAIGSYRGRFHKPSLDPLNEHKIGKELEDQVNNLVNQYCEENDYKLY